MTKNIRFYANREGNNSCMLACFKSAFEYLTGETYSWGKLEELTGYRPERAAWTVKIWTEMANKLDIQMIEAFDYKRYYDEGERYLHTFLKPEEIEWQLRESNLVDIRPLIPQFLETIRYAQRSPQLSDIDEMLAKGYLVFVQLNQKTLNKEPGYAAHMILVYDKEDGSYIAHDPGLPPFPNRKIKPELLLEAMGGKDNTVEVTGVMRKS